MLHVAGVEPALTPLPLHVLQDSSRLTSMSLLQGPAAHHASDTRPIQHAQRGLTELHACILAPSSQISAFEPPVRSGVRLFSSVIIRASLHSAQHANQEAAGSGRQRTCSQRRHR